MESTQNQLRVRRRNSSFCARSLGLKIHVCVIRVFKQEANERPIVDGFWPAYESVVHVLPLNSLLSTFLPHSVSLSPFGFPMPFPPLFRLHYMPVSGHQCSLGLHVGTLDTRVSYPWQKNRNNWFTATLDWGIPKVWIWLPLKTRKNQDNDSSQFNQLQLFPMYRTSVLQLFL